MQITNASQGVRAIRSLNLKLNPGEIATVKDDEWKKARKNKVVEAWLESGELKELSAAEANKAKEAKGKEGEGEPKK